MNPVGFQYEARIRIERTRPEVISLRAVCERHYDSAVRALSKPGIGAVLNGAWNDLEFDQPQPEKAVAVFTYRQLDTLCKGLEGAETKEETALYLRAMKLLRLLGREGRRVDTAPEATPAQTWWDEKLRTT